MLCGWKCSRYRFTCGDATLDSSIVYNQRHVLWLLTGACMIICNVMWNNRAMNHRAVTKLSRVPSIREGRLSSRPLIDSVMNNVMYCRDGTEFTGQIWVTQVIILLHSELIPRGSRIVSYGNVRLGQQRALVANNNVALIFNRRSLDGRLLCGQHRRISLLPPNILLADLIKSN